jgi:AI-2 transport system permease protein
MQFVIFFVLVLLSYVLLHRTNYGRKVFLCGVNQNAAEFSGINTRAVIMSTYAFSGLSASIAGILLTAYLGTAKADMGCGVHAALHHGSVVGGTSTWGQHGARDRFGAGALAVGLPAHRAEPHRLVHTVSGIPWAFFLMVDGIVPLRRFQPQASQAFRPQKAAHGRIQGRLTALPFVALRV